MLFIRRVGTLCKNMSHMVRFRHRVSGIQPTGPLLHMETDYNHLNITVNFDQTITHSYRNHGLESSVSVMTNGFQTDTLSQNELTYIARKRRTIYQGIER